MTIVEYLDRILPGMGLDTCKTFQRILAKQGLRVRSAPGDGAWRTEAGAVVNLEPPPAEPKVRPTWF